MFKKKFIGIQSLDNQCVCLLTQCALAMVQAREKVEVALMATASPKVVVTIDGQTLNNDLFKYKAFRISMLLYSTLP